MRCCLSQTRRALFPLLAWKHFGFDARQGKIRCYFINSAKYTTAMFSHSQTPLLARLSAIFTGLVFSLTVACASAQSAPPADNPAVNEIQRLMKQGQMSQAMDKAEQLISARPRDAQGRFLKGLILTETGRQADAIAVFTRLTEDFPELPEPYNNLAVLYAQQKQYDKARSALEMAIRTHPSYSIAHENLGDVYAKLASQAYNKALQLDSSNKATQSKLAMIKDLTASQPAATGKPGARPAAQTETPAAAKPGVTETAKPLPVAPPPVVKPAEVKEPVAKPQEVKPAEPKPVAPTAEADITKALQGWANAWSNKDVKAYLGYYAPDFQTPNGMARKAWETERTQRIDKPGKLQVSLDNVKINVSGDKATVKFRQQYKSATLKSSTGKTIVFIKAGNRWLIQQERVG